MIIIVAFVIFALVYLFVEVRLFIQHPFKTVYYVTRDIYEYVAYHLYDKYEGGQLNCYDAHFGGGKTLSGTHYIRLLFKRYNNKRIYDKQKRKWVIQKVVILSNVVLNDTNCVPLTSLSQIVSFAMHQKEIDEKEGTRTCIIVFVDEASSEMNSRNFKSNFDANFVNTLITSRHFNMSLYYTSQKFKLVDALLRSVTQRVVWCDKRWRFMVQHFYDADEMEYATNPTLVKPIARKGFFICNSDFEAYDTLATVERLDKDTKEGKMLSAEEILALRGETLGDNDMITKPSRKLKRIRKTS